MIAPIIAMLIRLASPRTVITETSMRGRRNNVRYLRNRKRRKKNDNTEASTKRAGLCRHSRALFDFSSSGTFAAQRNEAIMIGHYLRAIAATTMVVAGGSSAAIAQSGVPFG